MGAGDDDIGAFTSSIDPKETDGPPNFSVRCTQVKLINVCNVPCFVAAPTLREMPTPSFMGMFGPRALGRREWVGCEGGADGAGD